MNTEKLRNSSDYTNRYSYFFEAFEGYSGQDDLRAVPALKYMLLCKIMLNLVRSFSSLLSLGG